eukprot:57689-Chlamydomonas_euryale.AAC.1
MLMLLLVVVVPDRRPPAAFCHASVPPASPTRPWVGSQTGRAFGDRSAAVARRVVLPTTIARRVLGLLAGGPQPSGDPPRMKIFISRAAPDPSATVARPGR